jgi:hypothetical protein
VFKQPFICRAVGSKTLESKTASQSKAEFTKVVKSDNPRSADEKRNVEVAKNDICVLKSHTSEVWEDVYMHIHYKKKEKINLHRRCLFIFVLVFFSLFFSYLSVYLYTLYIHLGVLLCLEPCQPRAARHR